jgi:hypothetical protein
MCYQNSRTSQVKDCKQKNAFQNISVILQGLFNIYEKSNAY